MITQMTLLFFTPLEPSDKRLESYYPQTDSYKHTNANLPKLTQGTRFAHSINNNYQSFQTKLT